MRQPWPIHGIQVFFFLLFLSVPALNFWFCRLPALDFGIANQALFAYADGRDANCTFILQRDSMPYLSLHFSLWVLLVSPLKWLFGKWTLLLFQAFALVFAGEGIRRVAEYFGFTKVQQVLILLHTYSIGFIYSAIADGFHDNLIAACFVPWLFWSILKEKRFVFWLSFLAILISKENMAIWLLFLIPGLFALANKIRTWKWWVTAISFALIYFVVITQLVMPQLSPAGRFEQLDRFSHLGKGLTEIVTFILLHPLEMLKMMFFSHVQPDELENIKWEFWLVFLVSGALFSLRNPIFFLAFLPLVFQKEWNKEVVFWGINYHYQIEFVPLLSLGLLVFVARHSSRQGKNILLILALVSSLSSTVYHWHQRKSVWYESTKENLLSKAHYQSEISFGDLSPALPYIQTNHSLSTNSGLLPHLVLVDKLLLFPVIPDNGYVLLRNDGKDAYPLSEEEYQHELDALRKGIGKFQGFKQVWSSERLSLFKRE